MRIFYVIIGVCHLIALHSLWQPTISKEGKIAISCFLVGGSLTQFALASGIYKRDDTGE